MTRSTGLPVYVGTYTAKGSEGIHLLRFDAEAGRLERVDPVAALPNPTFQRLHPSGRFLFSVSEVRDAGGRRGGSVSAFRVDPATGRLSALNQRSSEGAGPCHLGLDGAGRFAVVSNYASGSVAVLPVGADGRLGEASCAVQHEGASGVDPQRQEGPHVHSATVSPDGRFVFVADLGLDRIAVYRLDAARGTLAPGDPPRVETAPGAGPRHFAFHPDGRHAYAVHELGNTVTAFEYDAERGALRALQTLSTLPAGYAGTSYAADLHVAPSGRFLYASNRGHDSLAPFRVDLARGTLSAAGHDSSGGKWPRNFALAPDGRFLLAANQNSDSVVVFRVDTDTGRLAPTGAAVEVSMPVCLTLG